MAEQDTTVDEGGRERAGAQGCRCGAGCDGRDCSCGEDCRCGEDCDCQECACGEGCACGRTCACAACDCQDCSCGADCSCGDRAVPAPSERQREDIRALRALLATGAGVGAEGAYDPRVLTGMAAAQELTGEDHAYLEHVDEVRDRGIAVAGLADLGTLLTYLVRGERYRDGHIGGAIANGKLGRVLDRLAELVPGLD